MIETDTCTYTPYADPDTGVVGFVVTRKSDGAVTLIYLNPSHDDESVEDDSPAVFVYMGPNGVPGEDEPCHFYNIEWEDA